MEIVVSNSRKFTRYKRIFDIAMGSSIQPASEEILLDHILDTLLSKVQVKLAILIEISKERVHEKKMFSKFEMALFEISPHTFPRSSHVNYLFWTCVGEIN